jgi:uncharacterized membrane protein YjfL (UPF0719 family)
MTPTVIRIGVTAAYAVIVLVIMLAGRLASDGLFRPVRPGHASNLALSLRHGGLYLAVAIAMTGALQGNTSGLLAGVLEVLRNGVVIALALLLAQKLNHWCVIPGLDNDQAVADGNTAVALTEFGSYIATGMIASASFGEGEGSWLTAAVFFALGQLALIGGFWAQERLLPGSFVAEVARGREGAGVAVAGVLIALGVILRASIAGPFLGWQASLRAFGLYALGGVFFLVAFQEIFTYVFVKRRHVEDQYHNVGTSSVVACGQIGLALVITALL